MTNSDDLLERLSFMSHPCAMEAAARIRELEAQLAAAKESGNA